MVSDSNKKYLSTDLMKDEKVKEGYFSPDIELLDYAVYKRVCKTCCDIAHCTVHGNTGCSQCN